jgi:CRISPR type I-E-associated protein CasB/Cse2
MTQADSKPDAIRATDDAITDIVARIGHESFGTGPLAELRRMDPRQGAQGVPTMHRLLARYVPDDWLGGDAIHRWALLVHLLALAAPEQHRGGASLGTALFAVGYSEGRLTRLLEAREADLDVVLPRMVRFLVAKGERLNPYELARFVLRRGGEAERLRIARDYYRAEAKQPDAA